MLSKANTATGSNKRLINRQNSTVKIIHVNLQAQPTDSPLLTNQSTILPQNLSRALLYKSPTLSSSGLAP